MGSTRATAMPAIAPRLPVRMRPKPASPCRSFWGIPGTVGKVKLPDLAKWQLAEAASARVERHGGDANPGKPAMSNTPTIARACRAALAGFALVILSASLAEAEYGPRTTIGVNYQQTSTTTSTDGINEGSCNGSSSCAILFQRAPEQKRLIVQHVSCRVNLSTGGLRYGILQTRKGQTFPLRRTYLTALNTGTFSVVNSPVMHLVESKENPLLSLQNSANANWFTLQCSISGQLKQP
jgi:hypothetical protein